MGLVCVSQEMDAIYLFCKMQRRLHIYYSGTLKCDHLDNLTTLSKRPLFSWPVLVLLCLIHLDKVATSLI